MTLYSARGSFKPPNSASCLLCPFLHGVRDIEITAEAKSRADSFGIGYGTAMRKRLEATWHAMVANSEAPDREFSMT